MSYWAKIAEDKIIFYSEDTLKREGLWENLYDLRKNFKEYQRPVSLSPQKIKMLKNSGVEVLMPNFLALKGIWHWFTGSSHMDAFRLNSHAEKN